MHDHMMSTSDRPAAHMNPEYSWFATYNIEVHSCTVRQPKAPVLVPGVASSPKSAGICRTRPHFWSTHDEYMSGYVFGVENGAKLAKLWLSEADGSSKVDTVPCNYGCRSEGQLIDNQVMSQLNVGFWEPDFASGTS